MKTNTRLILTTFVACVFTVGSTIAADTDGNEKTDLKQNGVATKEKPIENKSGALDLVKTGEQGENKADEHDLEKLGKQMNNPVGAAWMLWTQNDFTIMDGDAVDDSENWNSLKFQPVMSFPYKMGGDPWNAIVRPTFQHQSYSLNGDRTTGFGDTALDIAFGPDRTDGVIWGLGVASIFPTAEHDAIGQGKWQAGPAALFAHLAPKVGGFNYGVFGQHWWSYAGDDDRPDTSLTDVQYFVQYRLNKTATLGMAPNIQYDWEADSDNALKLPVGMGYQNVIKIGNIPVKYGLEFQYYAVQADDFGPEWNVRFIFVPVIPSPF